MVTGVLIQSITKTIVMINYSLNKDYISKNLCEKRKVKNNKCNGSCHLKLKLKQSDDSGAKEPPSLKDKSEQVLYCNFSFVKLRAVKYTQYIFPVPVLHFPQPTHLPVFHPPQSWSTFA
jgi:hypothetical protein